MTTKDLIIILLIALLVYMAFVVLSLIPEKRCYKSEQGYNCKHQIMSNGQLECGTPPPDNKGDY